MFYCFVISYIGLVLYTEKTKNMEAGRHPDMMADEHVMVGSNSYEKIKNVNIDSLYSD